MGVKRTVCLALAAAAIAAGPARASLGGQLATVETDGVRLRAQMRSAPARGHMVHSLATQNGTVREVARADGTVFAVTWSGRARPDLRQLLGDRFATMQAAPQIRRGIRSRQPLDIRATGLVLRAVRRPGGFVGYAYAPDLAPADFSADDLR